jgi:hypothetical protein
MDKGLMAEGWDSFRGQVMPADAPDGLVLVMRTAFYAGASYLMAQVMLRLGPDENPGEEDFAWMDGIHAELVAFSKSGRG